MVVVMVTKSATTRGALGASDEIICTNMYNHCVHYWRRQQHFLGVRLFISSFSDFAWMWFRVKWMVPLAPPQEWNSRQLHLAKTAKKRTKNIQQPVFAGRHRPNY